MSNPVFIAGTCGQTAKAERWKMRRAEETIGSPGA